MAIVQFDKMADRDQLDWLAGLIPGAEMRLKVMRKLLHLTLGLSAFPFFGNAARAMNIKDYSKIPD